jgi:hypothetical protein
MHFFNVLESFQMQSNNFTCPWRGDDFSFLFVFKYHNRNLLATDERGGGVEANKQFLVRLKTCS